MLHRRGLQRIAACCHCPPPFATVAHIRYGTVCGASMHKPQHNHSAPTKPKKAAVYSWPALTMNHLRITDICDLMRCPTPTASCDLPAAPAGIALV